MVSNNIHILFHAFALSTPSAEPRHRQSIAARRVKVPSPDVLPGNKERKPATKLKKKIHYTSGVTEQLSCYLLGLAKELYVCVLNIVAC